MVEITHDTFFIADRLREIDPEYRLFYNGGKSRFEVRFGARDEVPCAVLPYDELDCRALDYVRMTRRENFDRLFKEVEENNERAGGSYFALQGNYR